MEVYSTDILDFNIALKIIEGIWGFTVQEQSQSRYVVIPFFLVLFKLFFSLRNQKLLFTEWYVIRSALQCDFTLHFLFTALAINYYF